MINSTGQGITPVRPGAVQTPESQDDVSSASPFNQAQLVAAGAVASLPAVPTTPIGTAQGAQVIAISGESSESIEEYPEEEDTRRDSPRFASPPTGTLQLYPSTPFGTGVDF